MTGRARRAPQHDGRPRGDGLPEGDEVVVTYESNVSGGGKGRNTEVFTFADEDKIARTEVYFGWNLE